MKQSIQTLSKQKILPRRYELQSIIEDNPFISFESLARKFPTVPKRTIANDISWLIKKNLVIKHGESREVLYSAKNS